jgi:sugar O-acyltransferase (sialic acid O-acetyltransferase NeuD family)
MKMAVSEKKVVIIGSGEHAGVVFETALKAGWTVEGYISPQVDKNFEKRFNLKYLGSDDEIIGISKERTDLKFISAVGDNAQRVKIIDNLSALPDERWAIIIHPSAVVSDFSEIGIDTVVFSRAIIQTGAVIGRHVIINSGAVVEHDCAVFDFVHIAPGAVTGGGVKIGEYSFLGLGSRVRDHINIAEKCTVGAGSVVVRDIPAGETVVGIPASKIVDSAVNRDIKDFCIPPETTLYDAMALIGKYGAAALITDSSGKLLGLLNDGDIRRALLERHDFDTPVKEVMNRNYRFVRENVPRIAALDQLKASGHRLMPVLDDDGRVVGLHLLDAMIGSLSLPNIAVIMAGGKGTRLRPITENIPKPMVKVAGRPILEHIILHLAGSNIRKIYIAVNYLGEMIEEYFKDGSAFGVEIHYLREETPLGTVRALKLIPEKPQHPFIVMNGDLVTQFDVERMLHYHKQGNYKLTIGAHDYRVDIPYGVIEWDDSENRVSRLREKPKQHFLINGGIYVIEPDMIDFIEEGRMTPITELIEKGLEHGYRIGAHLVEGDWMDIGRPSELAAARGNA